MLCNNFGVTARVDIIWARHAFWELHSISEPQNEAIQHFFWNRTKINLQAVHWKRDRRTIVCSASFCRFQCVWIRTIWGSAQRHQAKRRWKQNKNEGESDQEHFGYFNLRYASIVQLVRFLECRNRLCWALEEPGTATWGWQKDVENQRMLKTSKKWRCSTRRPPRRPQEPQEVPGRNESWGWVPQMKIRDSNPP